jgi:replication-associated recombination protein RarA
MDEWKSMYFFFTATNLDNFPNALLQRTIHVRIEKANDVDLRQLIIDVCAAENIRVQDEAAIQKLIRLCRSNFRNVLNTLEWLKGVESGLNSESLENPIIRTHAGLGINLKN